MAPQSVSPKVFVLVHPAWHGGWFWKKVVALVRQRGHLLIAPDHPAVTMPGEVANLLLELAS